MSEVAEKSIPFPDANARLPVDLIVIPVVSSEELTDVLKSISCPVVA